MSNVSMNGPIDPTQPSTSSGTTGGGTPSAGTQDSIGGAPAVNPFLQLADPTKGDSISLAAPMTIIEYEGTVGTATNANKEQATLNQLINSNIFSQFARGLIDQTQLVQDIQMAVNNLGTEIENVETTENQQVTDLQNQISATDTAIGQNGSPTAQQVLDNYQSAVDTFNGAVAAANGDSGAIKTAQHDLNIAIGTYKTNAGNANSANSSAIQQLNQAITTFLQQQTQNNQTISNINQQLNSLGLSAQDLPLENYTVDPFTFALKTMSTIPEDGTTTTAPKPNPATIPSASTVNPLNNFQQITVVNASDFVTQNLQNILDSLGINANVVLYNFSNAYTTAVALNNQKTSKTAGKKLYLPDAYISTHPILAAFSVVNAGGGSALVNTAASGTPGQNEKAVSDALQKAFLQLNGVSVPDDTLKKLANFTIQLSANGSLFSAMPGLSNLGAAAMSSADANMAFNVAFGISNAQAVAQIIQSGVIQGGAGQILTQDLQGTDPASINKAIDVATAVINQYLVTVSLAGISNDFGTPGLIGQVLGNASTTTAASLAKAATTPPTIQQTLTDTSNQLFLKNYLNNLLVNISNGQVPNTTAFINQTINNLISSGVSTQTGLQQALSAAFANLQLSASEQQLLVTLAIATIDAIQNATQVLSSQLSNEQEARALLQQQLQIQNVANSNYIARKAIDDITNNISITNNEQYRLDLAADLEAQGIQDDIAQQIALSVVIKAGQENSVLFNPIAQNPAPIPALADQIHDYVYNTLSHSLDPVTAHEVARSASATIVGAPEERDQEIHANAPPSLLALYQTSQKILDGYGVTPSSAYVAGDFIKKTDDSLYTLNMIHEPGKLLLHSSWTSAFSAGVAGDTSAGLPRPGRGTTNPVLAA